MNWILLRGLGRHLEHWGNFPEVLAEMFPRGRVFKLDMPGIGRERGVSSPRSIREITRYVREQWKLSEAGEPVRGPLGIVGISMGGMVALEWGRLFPGDFSHTVVINSSAGNLAPIWQRLRPPVFPRMLRIFLSRDPLERERLILKISTQLAPEELERQALHWASFDGLGPSRRIELINQIIAATRYTLKGAVPGRLLVLASRRDQMVSPECSYRLAARLGAPLFIHDHAGHDLPLEEPEWTSRTIAEWMGEALAGARLTESAARQATTGR